MGMFSSLFGSSGSDKADNLRQQAIDAFNSIKTPELSQLQVQLQQYVNAGKLTPQQAESQLLSSNAFNAIATDPSYVGAQKQALQQLQQIGTQGGLTAVDRAQLNDITNQQNQQNQSQNAATMQQAQQRGIGGSSLNVVNQLANEQGNADRAANQGLGVAAQAQQRALQAMQAAGTQGGQLEAQQYGEQANKAQSQNAINQFNAQTLNQQNLYNTQAANAAQAANLANQQAVNNANTQTGNANQEYNAQQVQQQYNDAMQKAQGEAGVYNNWANDATKQASTEAGANMGLTSGLLQGGATALGAAFGGPAGAVAANSATGSFNPKTDSTNPYDDTEPSFAEGGMVDDPEHPNHMAMGGHVHCYSHGGEAFHHPDCYMAKGGIAINPAHKGLLHEDLGVASDKKIPAKKLEKATHSSDEAVRKRAQFAENAKNWHHHSDGGMETPDIASNDDKQSFMQGMMGSAAAQHPLPIEWDQNLQKWQLRDTNGQPIGSFDKYPDAVDFANRVQAQKKSDGGKIDFRSGGHVPGKAKVKGDSPKNDTVDAKLSPGEIVIPRSASSDDDEFDKFMEKFRPSNQKKMAAGGMISPAMPRVNDNNPMRDTVHASMTNSVPLAATNDANSFTHMMKTFKPTRKEAPAPHIPLEAKALANLHKRVSDLEGGQF